MLPLSDNSRALPGSLPSSAGRPSPIHHTLLVALDAVIEEGVPRGDVACADCAVVAHWERVFQDAATVIETLTARWSQLRSTDPALTSLVVRAAAVATLAGEVGLGSAIDSGRLPALATLRATLETAFAYAQATRDDVLWTVLAGSFTGAQGQPRGPRSG